MSYKNKMVAVGYLNSHLRIVTCPICNKQFKTQHRGIEIPCSKKCADIQVNQFFEELKF